MSLVRRLANAVNDNGLGGVLAKIAAKPVDWWFDWRYGVDTRRDVLLSDLTLPESSRASAHHYEATRVQPLRALMPMIERLLAASPIARPPVLVDIGCGKGRVLLVAAEAGLATLRGVEIAPQLAEIARQNWQRFRRHVAPAANCDIIASDARDYRLAGDENLLSLFNPFEPELLGAVLDEVVDSARRSPRRMLVVVAYPSAAYRAEFDRRSTLQLTLEPQLWGCRFAIYRVEDGRQMAAGSQ